MRLDPGRRRLTLGAREFAVFGLPGRAGGDPARAAEGALWHGRMRDRMAAEDAAWRFETPVTLHRTHGRWSFAVEGRIDARRAEARRTLVREVKTVEGRLDAPAAFFLKRYPEHFAQLAVYCAALAESPECAGRPVVGEVLYVDTLTGATLAVRPDAPPDMLLERSLDALERFAEDRLSSRRRLSSLRFRPAHETPREGAEAARADLAEAAARSRIVLLEAPTGFGKTALALEFALARLRDGLCDRIVYLTGKNSGRIQVFRELERMVAPGALRALDLRRRDDHEADAPPVGEDGATADAEDFLTLFDDGPVTLARVREAGSRRGVAPWSITRALLSRAELIVADYNHVFSPAHAGPLRDAPGHDPARTLLIVDEAHNLPDRAAEARSLGTSAAEAGRTLDALEAAGAHRELRGAWLEWLRFLEDLPACDRLSGADEHALHDKARHLRVTLRTVRPPWETLPEEVARALHDAAAWSVALESAAPEDVLAHAPAAGVLRLDPLHAEIGIAEALRGAAGALLMSATLSPHGAFAAACGLGEGEFSSVAAVAPWREEAYEVFVDTRPDTRFSARERHFALTAETVVRFAAEGPTAVFFPSYRYAESVAAYVAALAPGFRAAVQPRGGSPETQAAFIEEALIGAHALFLVLGGSLAEGVDLLGGRVGRAIVVGPAIPDTTSPLQKARHARLRSTAGDRAAFREVSILPGMRKVNQALGRLVRAPGQRAVVLLHCRRFADAEHAAFLAPEYRKSRRFTGA